MKATLLSPVDLLGLRTHEGCDCRECTADIGGDEFAAAEAKAEYEHEFDELAEELSQYDLVFTMAEAA